MPTPRIDLLLGILNGDWTEESQAWITNGLRLALLEDMPDPLLVALDLPSTPAKVRLNIRDFHLAAAAASLDGDHEVLRMKVSRFGGHQWPAWQRLNKPPAHATGIERLLFLAFKAESRMPKSPRQWRYICGKIST